MATTSDTNKNRPYIRNLCDKQANIKDKLNKHKDTNLMLGYIKL